MRSLVPLILAFAAILVLPGGVASDTEAEPECETDQPWIGYARTDGARQAYAAEGSPGGLAVCEGEHWDGQDSVGDPAPACPLVCLSDDPNAAPGDDPVAPAAARASADADGGRAYAAANLAFGARAAVYADDGTVALYVRDNTPGNVVRTILASPSVTPGHPSYEADCDQATYQHDAYEAPGRICGRDNTAITLQHGLLP